jgi:DNA (cytosine-5)-methyltransferase 1
MREHFDILGHLEVSDYGVKSSQKNNPELHVRIDKAGEWNNYTGEQPDVIYGNPPCAPWSAAGSKSKGGARDYSQGGYDHRDGRVSCFLNAFALLERFHPDALVLESVTRLWTAGREFVQGLVDRARDIGYSTTIVLHDGFDCGVPQHRKRVLVIFHDVELGLERPAVFGPATVGDALAGLLDGPGPDLPRTWPEEQECLERAAPGAKLRKVYDEIYGETRLGERRPGQYAGRPGFLRQRLSADKPSPVHTGGSVLYHPTENRKISVREAQVLCGYPSSYEFVGSLELKFRQIAQAVMPPVGRWIGESLARAVARAEPIVGGPRYEIAEWLR